VYLKLSFGKSNKNVKYAIGAIKKAGLWVDLSASIPKRAFSLVETKPNEELYEVCIILKDVRGAIAETAKVLADNNVNIVAGSLFRLPERLGLGTWTLFIDVSKATRNINELTEELQKLDAVEDVRFKEPKPVPFEVIHFPMLHGDMRAIIMSIAIFRGLWKGFETILKPSGLEAVLYNVGKRIGSFYARYLEEKYGVKKMDLILAMAQAAKASGWGIPEIDEIDLEHCSGTVTIKESFEALAWEKKPYKVCHWIRGFISGFSTAAFGEPMEAVEIECMATGSKHCRFEIKPKTRRNSLKV
jgi:predicted hydrocarbon binding protein/ACT domain-containing protein